MADVFKYVNKSDAELTVGTHVFPASGSLSYAETQADLDVLDGVSVDRYVNGVPTEVEYTPNLVTLVASTTDRASLTVPHGVAPTSPVDGDIWTTNAGIFVRINGVTKTITIV